jgi:hypothetical protein
LTEATFQFGLKSEDWKIVGFVGLAISVILIVQPAIYVCKKCKSGFGSNPYKFQEDSSM